MNKVRTTFAHTVYFKNAFRNIKVTIVDDERSDTPTVFLEHFQREHPEPFSEVARVIIQSVYEIANVPTSTRFVFHAIDGEMEQADKDIFLKLLSEPDIYLSYGSSVLNNAKMLQKAKMLRKGNGKLVAE